MTPGKFDASLDLVDAGAFNPLSDMAIPCVNAKLDSNIFSFGILPLYVNYRSELSPDYKTLIGTWNLGDPAPDEKREFRYGLGQLKFTREEAHPRARNRIGAPIVAGPPIALDDLKPVLDRGFGPMLDHGVLSKTTGGGVVIGVLDHGQRRIFSFGKAQPDSIFEIGAITTTFTALALAQMVEQEKVTLDEPVRELLPAGTVVKPAGPEITLLGLATHHSGLPVIPSNLNVVQTGNPYADYHDLDLREFLGDNGVSQPSDAKYLYSWTGFGLLAYALALRAGLSYQQLIRTQITAPLHMDDTVVTLSPAQRRQLIQGHTAEFEPASAWDFDALAGAAGLKSTAADLLTYLDANLHPKSLAMGAGVHSPSATLAASLALAHDPRADMISPDTRMALAWFFNKQVGIFFQGGITGGYSSHLEFDPRNDRAIVVLYNRQDLTPGQLQFVVRVTANIDELMSGNPAIPLDYLSDIDRVTLAYAAHDK